MNKLELLVYNLVKRNPRLKRQVRDAYQRICDVMPVPDARSVSPIEVRPGFFFGFHDKSPWSADNQMLLAHRFAVPLRMPKPTDSVEVGYFSGPEFADFHAVGSTPSWNWHQGAMLQWLGSAPTIVFNDFDGQRNVARLVGADGKQVATLPLPVGAVSPDGSKALSYSFERTRIYAPGYAYANGTDPERDELVPARHGLHMIDIASGATRLLFSVADIAELEPEPSMQGTFHYLTHCQFSPSGRRFKFFHRWIKDHNQLWTRMISCDENGQDLFVFPTSGMVSHVAWRDDEHVLAYARTDEAGDRYYLFRDKTREFSIVGETCFSSDGHPSYSPDRRWIITDTYPNARRVSYLILYDTLENKRYDLARLRSPKEYAGLKFEDEWTCDLHPRWNRDGTAVCFDSAYTGRRSLCLMTLGDVSQLRGSQAPLAA